MLPGHSGYKLVFDDKEVVKISENSFVKSRALQEQAEAQKRFEHPVLKTPRVIGEESQFFGTSYAFSMERIHGTHPMATNNPLATIEKLADYIESNWENRHSLNNHETGVAIDRKLQSLELAIQQQEHFDIHPFMKALYSCREFFALYPIIPVGACHGDLTLCNVVVTPSQDVYLLDFGNPFIKSPILDLIKLRQDTQHRWITLFTDVDERMLEKADRYLVERFSKSSILNCPYYRYLDLLSLLRIVPYIKYPHILGHITRRIVYAHSVANLRGSK